MRPKGRARRRVWKQEMMITRYDLINNTDISLFLCLRKPNISSPSCHMPVLLSQATHVTANILKHGSIIGQQDPLDNFHWPMFRIQEKCGMVIAPVSLLETSADISDPLLPPECYTVEKVAGRQETQG